ncbi:hypothetical protein HOD41_09330 [bacterium]|nr:hypothetical protein [bacterium]
MEISLKGDMKKITRDLKKVERKVVPKATVRALKKTATKVQGRVRKRIAKRIGVAQKVIKQKQGIAKANFRKQSTVLYLRYKGINPLSIKKAQRMKKGFKVGKEKHPIAFSHDEKVILERKGKKQLPVRAVKIKIYPHKDKLHSIANILARRTFLKEFNRDLKWRLRKK